MLGGIARSAALLEAAGFAVIEPTHPPDPRSPRLGLPGGYHPGTRRLIHIWPADAPLPQALSL